MTSKIEEHLTKMVEASASDLYLTVGLPPSLRVNGVISAAGDTALDNTTIYEIVEELLNEQQRNELKNTLELNTTLKPFAGKRFRANFLYQQRSIGIVIRMIRTDIPTIESLGLPKTYADAAMEKKGLVLLVGASDTGKSTSLAAMLEHRNLNSGGHIITIEDPIEFIHQHKKCIFTQREIGVDTLSYAAALKNALRQTPDVIVIGEIRDLETMEITMQLCETGHLCISTLHASSANQAIERMINMFPEDARNQILRTISQNLKAVFSQQLVAGKTSGRVMAAEILLNQGLVRELIEEGKIREIKDIVEKNKDLGMQTFDQSLMELYFSGKISMETALAEATSASNLKLKIAQNDIYSVQSSAQSSQQTQAS